jgi:glutathione S-transferase
MELYYSPFACSMAARIWCVEASLPITFRRVDLGSKRIEGDSDGALYRINSLGKVPTLVTDEGTVLSENVAVLLHLSDRATERGRKLGGAVPRYELVRWLSFVATEIHKGVLATIFSLARPPESAREFARSLAPRALEVVERHLEPGSGLVGEPFTAADAYLVWALFLLGRPMKQRIARGISQAQGVPRRDAQAPLGLHRLRRRIP